MNNLPKRALLSVSDKTHIERLAQKLIEHGVEIISTGGTAKHLSSFNIPYTPIQNVTGNPEAFGGRMKTISFQVGSALLFRRDHPEDLKEAQNLGIGEIDLVVCNLYPFKQVAQTPHRQEADLIENIDIGGPQMIRAAAKNMQWVSVLTDPRDYESYIQALDQKKISTEQRKEWALKAFSLTAQYDMMVALTLAQEWGSDFPDVISNEVKPLRYGENPHQKAKLFILPNQSTNQMSLANAPVLQGKEISYNNYLDADQAFKCVSQLSHVLPKLHHVVIVKHGIPCGVASAETQMKALEGAWASDPISAFGGIVAFSSAMEPKTAEFLSQYFLELIIAPKFTEQSCEILALKKNLRLIALPLKSSDQREWTLRSINGGVLWQEEDELSQFEGRVVTQRQFNNTQQELLFFGQTVVKYLKSNCLLIASVRDGVLFTMASGVGQPNRLECMSLILKEKIKDKNLEQAILFSDAFFPFRDSIDAACELGVEYIVQPGGSMRDQEVIEACNEKNIAMMMTSQRHFRH